MPEVHERYTYSVTWSDEDAQYVGTCEELGGLSNLADSQELALSGIVVLVADVVRDLQANGEMVPDPAHRTVVV